MTNNSPQQEIEVKLFSPLTKGGELIAIGGIVTVMTDALECKNFADKFYKELGIEYEIKSIVIDHGQE